MPAAEDIKWQVAVAVVVAVEEATFLVPVQRIVGGIQVQPDLTRWLPLRFEKDIDQQTAALVDLA